MFFHWLLSVGLPPWSAKAKKLARATSQAAGLGQEQGKNCDVQIVHLDPFGKNDG